MRETQHSQGTSKSGVTTAGGGGAFQNLGNTSFRGEAMYNKTPAIPMTLLLQEGHAETLGALPGITENNTSMRTSMPE